MKLDSIKFNINKVERYDNYIIPDFFTDKKLLVSANYYDLSYNDRIDFVKLIVEWSKSELNILDKMRTNKN